MRVQRDARQRAARLALAAGDQDQDVVVGHVVDVVLAEERRQPLQIAAFARRGVDVAQRSGRPAPRCGRRRARRSAIDSTRATLLAKQVTATRPRRPRISADSALAHLGLAAGMALDHRIGGVADHRQHALVAQRRQRGLVGRRADQRRRVELPVAGVQHGAVRRVDHQRLRFRDRVRHADEAQREGLQVDRAAGRHHVELHLVAATAPRPACGAAPRRRTGWHRPGSAAAATARRPRRYGPHARG